MFNFNSIVKSAIIKKTDMMLEKYHTLCGYQVKAKLSGCNGIIISKERFLELSGIEIELESTEVLIEFEDEEFCRISAAEFVQEYNFSDDTIASNLFMMFRPNEAVVDSTISRLNAAQKIRAKR